VPARVLVAEDEEGVANVLVRSLKEAGYDVVRAANGWEAWREAQNQSFDLVVTDHVMPMMTGNHLVKRVREQFPQMPVILVTGYSAVDTPTQYPEDITIMYKPFQSQALIAEVERLLKNQ
jgi:DNA-binding NtrC family response regulator